MSIKRAMPLCSVCFLLMLCCMVPTSLVASSWRISCEPEPAVFRQADSEKMIWVILKNVSDHDAWVWESNTEADYDMKLTDLKGVTISMTEKGIYRFTRLRTEFTSSAKVNIAPEVSYKNWTNLNNFYELSPGKYILYFRLRTINRDNYDFPAHKRLPESEKDIPAGSVSIEIKP